MLEELLVKFRLAETDDGRRLQNLRRSYSGKESKDRARKGGRQWQEAVCPLVLWGRFAHLVSGTDQYHANNRDCDRIYTDPVQRVSGISELLKARASPAHVGTVLKEPARWQRSRRKTASRPLFQDLRLTTGVASDEGIGWPRRTFSNTWVFKSCLSSHLFATYT